MEGSADGREHSTGAHTTPSSLRSAESIMATEASSNAKSKRYDRQIRIWGTEGQQRLESCKLCLLNCGPTGAETLKNLVLGGIAGFTIVDGRKVEAADLGNNFMLGPDSLGELRAKIVTEHIKELNDLVAGSYVEEAPESMIKRNPQFFAQFNVVVATQLREPDVLKLEEICRQQHVILLVVRSYGLAGIMRPSVPEHTVIEAKLDNVVEDLRLHDPWPELQQFADSFHLQDLDDVTLHHVPYVVLLIKASQAWRASHGGALPSTSKERSAFKEAISELKRMAGDVPIDSENFEEATKAAFHVWSKYTISSEVRAILADECASDDAMGPNTSDFWLLVAALRRFVEHQGGGQYLPLEGSIPDMHATTDLFLRTQRVYRDKAERDVAAVETHLAELITRSRRDGAAIPHEKVRLFCKNARNLRVVRFRTLSQEYAAHGGRGDMLASALGSEGAAVAALYVLVRAADRFHAAHGRFPGSTLDTSLEEDVPALKQCVQQILGEMGASAATVPDDYVLETVRFGAAELHVVASIMGGIAAQETIKLVTGQFTCVPGTLVFNGIGATSAVLEL